MRILVADDESISRRLVESALRKAGHEVVVAKDGEEAWKQLDKEEFEIAVLDWMMPGMEGISICEKLRKTPREYYLYIILLTGKADHKDIIRGLDAGADEFLVKPFDADELRARVRAGERIVTLERRLKNVNLQLEALAATDELTGLLNRRAILARIKEEAKRADREGGILFATQKRPIGTCIPWEEFARDIPSLQGDVDLMKKTWQDVDALGYSFLWTNLTW